MYIFKAELSWLLAKRCECNNYNLTSQAEEDDEDDEGLIKLMRKRTKKGPPDGFVRNGMFLFLK